MNGNLLLLLLLGGAAFLLLSNKSVAMATPGVADDSHPWSLSDAVRSRGTLGLVANGWTTGWDGTQSCPPGAMC